MKQQKVPQTKADSPCGDTPVESHGHCWSPSWQGRQAGFHLPLTLVCFLWLSSDHPEASRKSSKLLLPRYGPGAVSCLRATVCAPIAYTAPPPSVRLRKSKLYPSLYGAARLPGNSELALVFSLLEGWVSRCGQTQVGGFSMVTVTPLPCSPTPR